MSKSRSKVEEAQIDLTPMLDCVFIMLIFFIVTTSFAKESGVEVNRPETFSPIPASKANLFVGLTEDGEIYMEKRLIPVEAVRSEIERLRAENPEGDVVIQADKNAKNGVLMQVIDAIKAAGVDHVSVAATAAQGG
ncbi:MAG: biopolymer transporter ExbD [Gammaproteobacteria bacterium]|nr:biopolymer transporter ExbD [Gammaproteobacteria bacterium]